ncbi:MAG: DMT family transporter [Nitrospinaceae bacterium]|nr:DMT family transporter [Nitrospinaceae bacterium]MBT3433715.1 DMT family transporter [Nitrospinaceae bacterium]MBT3823168.1 DMT family transporter [Nitrospinaceae bacterium]MBT4093431.1 DMT family transporter [Nitrospinaceae bacterium]MBT4429252.1 DMT family transporter [Nitrospinaceae bacterium]
MDIGIAIGLAIISAITFGIFSVMARKAMNLGSAISASTVSVMVGLPIMLALSLYYSSWGNLTLEGTFWFALTGFLAPGLARPLIYLSIRYVGVGRAMPLITVTPFISMLLAVAWLTEEPSPVIYGATTLVVVGCFLIALKPKGDADWLRIFLLLPIVHSLVMAFATTTRRYSLLVLPDFLIGIIIASIASLPAVLLFWPFLPVEERWRIEEGGLKMMIQTGLLNSFSFLMFFASFQYGPVSIVVPIAYSAPFFALICTRIWLRDEEILTWQKCVGAATLFVGVVLIVINAS